MRDYASNIDNRMFDFQVWYDLVAKELPNNCRLVEIGNADGASAIYLAESILNLGKTIDKFFLVDNMGYGKYNQMKAIYTNIINANLGEWLEVIPEDSVKASKLFNGNSLDFVFIDSSHQFNSMVKEIKAWYPLVKDDCIISGHDIFSDENPGVAKAVYKLLPHYLTRPTINEPTHYQEFEPEPFLQTMDTEQKNGVWFVKKNFYFKP